MLMPDQPTRWWDLPQVIGRGCISEWRARTLFGKVCYPLWLLKVATVSLVILTVFAPMLVVKLVGDLLDQLFHGVVSMVRRFTPRIYKNDP